jgi:endonuclease/exonuclease/phosphatase family metal-dependent hydrolase
MMPRVRRGLITLLVLAAVGLVVIAGRLGKSRHEKNPEDQGGVAAGAQKLGRLPPLAKKKKTKVKAHAVPDSPFFSLAACEASLTAHPRAAQRAPRVGSWNVRWFPLGTKDGSNPERVTDVPWLACTIASMDVDVLAVQEFLTTPQGRTATQDLTARLDKYTKGNWKAVFDDCPGSDRQHVGFLYDEKRVTVTHPKPVAALNPGKDSCDKSLRPGYGMYAKFKNGPDLNLVSVHFDSGTTQRDIENRKVSIGNLAGAAKELGDADHDPDLIVLGDFNTMGCKDCNPSVDGKGEVSALDDALDPIGLRRVHMPKNRECTEYEKKGMAQSQIDLVVASTQMEEVAKDAHVELSGVCKDFGCKPPYKAEYPLALDKLSDHCPVILELGTTDADAPAGKGAPAAKPAAPAAAAAKPAAAKPAAPAEAPLKQAAAAP